MENNDWASARNLAWLWFRREGAEREGAFKGAARDLHPVALLIGIGAAGIMGDGNLRGDRISAIARSVQQRFGLSPLRERSAKGAAERAKHRSGGQADLSPAQTEAKEWLMAQGYRAGEAEQAVRDCGATGEAEEIFKAALKEMVRLRGL